LRYLLLQDSPQTRLNNADGVLGISRLEKSLVALSMLLGLFHVLSFGFCLQDDAYIGLRYSRNLSDGNGLVFNPNEHVEGYTNFSWIIISTIP
jgi:hypothetical protein